MAAQTDTGLGRFIHTNGVDIHFTEAGAGEPLILLENGMISTSPIWAGWLSSYLGQSRPSQSIAGHRPDFRGSGRTVHPGGPIPYDLLADDMVAMIDALRLDRPLVCGYGDGGHVATIIGIRKPASVRAVVNHGGFDLLNPDPRTPGLVMTRQMLGGAPDAAQADPDVMANSEHTFLRAMAEVMQADHDAAQGPDHWKKVLIRCFERFSQPCGYTVDDLAAITAPTLIVVGDRDRSARSKRAPAPTAPWRWRARGAAEHCGRDQPSRCAGSDPVLPAPARRRELNGRRAALRNGISRRRHRGPRRANLRSPIRFSLCRTLDNGARRARTQSLPEDRCLEQHQVSARNSSRTRLPANVKTTTRAIQEQPVLCAAACYARLAMSVMRHPLGMPTLGTAPPTGERGHERRTWRADPPRPVPWC